MFVVSTLLARTARGAVGTAIVDLQPGASPEMLRDALARALGDSTLQLAFRVPDGPGYLDTAGMPSIPAQLGPGRALTALAAAGDAVLIHDRGLEQEPQLVRLTASAASMALEHARLQAEVQAQLEQVRASRARIVEAGDAERRRLERDLHDGAQQRLVTLSLALGMAREQAAGADPALQVPARVGRQGGQGSADRAARTGPRHPSRRADRDRAGRRAPGAGRALGCGDDDRARCRAGGSRLPSRPPRISSCPRHWPTSPSMR